MGWLESGPRFDERDRHERYHFIHGVADSAIRFGFVPLGPFTRVTRLENVFQTELYESRRDGRTSNFAKARDADDRVRIVELRVSAALTTNLVCQSAHLRR